MPNMTSELPGTGDLVSVRGQKWVVAFADPQPHNTLVELQSVEDGRYGDTLSIIWEVEPNCTVVCIDTDFADMVIADRAYFYFPTSSSTAGVSMPNGRIDVHLDRRGPGTGR